MVVVRRVVVVLAAAVWQCFDVGAGRGTEHDRTPGPNMRATPAPRFCSEHPNNVNQTSAFGPWLLLLRRGLANLTTSRLRLDRRRRSPPSAAAKRAHEDRVVRDDDDES